MSRSVIWNQLQALLFNKTIFSEILEIKLDAKVISNTITELKPKYLSGVQLYSISNTAKWPLYRTQFHEHSASFLIL